MSESPSPEAKLGSNQLTQSQEGQATNRNRERPSNNYVWTPNENRILLTWTEEHLPQVWKKASVINSTKIKKALYNANPSITVENVRHKINNIKAKYRRAKARHNITAPLDEEGLELSLEPEVLKSLTSEFPEFFKIRHLLKKSQEKRPAPDDDVEMAESHDSAEPEEIRIQESKVSNEVLLLRNERLKLEVTRLKAQLEAKERNDYERENSYKKLKIETDKSIAELKLIEHKIKLVIEQYDQLKREGRIPDSVPTQTTTADLAQSTLSTSEPDSGKEKSSSVISNFI